MTRQQKRTLFFRMAFSSPSGLVMSIDIHVSASKKLLRAKNEKWESMFMVSRETGYSQVSCIISTMKKCNEMAES